MYLGVVLGRGGRYWFPIMFSTMVSEKIGTSIL